MVQLVCGRKGKGKTTVVLNKVNEEIKTARGSIVFIDRNSAHMFELNNRIRLIDMSRFPVLNSDEFVGFVCGVISQDHDLESMYLDGFLKVSGLDADTVTEPILKLDRIASDFNINIVISVSLDKEELSPEIQDKVLISL
ncbi:MAG: twitching motility protein PilT [Lachnospiraceae bacterium]|nr:twitching motility protein PilT [Lachnospiraceae bacterium]